jgi:RNA polymerase sigma-70 factor (ECF subfamily)
MFQPRPNYNSLPDTELLQLMAQDDQLAFAKLYQRHVDILYRTAYKRLPLPYKAEDLVQEIFLTLYRKRHELTDIQDIRAWLFTTLRHRILNEIRDLYLHEQHHQQIATHTPQTTTPLTEYELKQLETQLHQALTQLTERCRQIFLLSRSQQRTNREIAQQLGISIQAVEKHMGRALRLLRRELGKDYNLGIILFL